MEKRVRLDWVDVAKGIAILLMVIGHEVQNQHIHAFIFSFHMPLFFILSGFTSRRVNTWQMLERKLRKSFTHVWLLAVLMVILLGIENLLFLKEFSFVTFYQSVLRGIFWGSNIPTIGLMSVGVMWFMFVFFWAKLLFDILQVVLSDAFIGGILIILSGISMFYCQNFTHYLPQAFDIVPIAALFMWTGSIARKVMDDYSLIKGKSVFYFMIITFWIICFILNIYIELSIRHYPLTFVSIVEALGGTLAVSLLSKWSVSYKVSKALQIIGKHTLAVMCIHHLDLYWTNWGNWIHWWPVASIIRLLLDLGLLFVFLLIQNKIKGRKLAR